MYQSEYVDNTVLAAVVSRAQHKIALAQKNVLATPARIQTTVCTTRTRIRRAC